MFDYISALYHGSPVHTPIPCPLDNRDTPLYRHMEQVRQEMGEPFARELDKILRIELNGSRSEAFCDGLRLGGRLMLSILEDAGD